MKAIDFYYQIKPAIPRQIQISLRRIVASRKRRAYADIWPIDPSAAKHPEGWGGWPETKKFALILQHDVDSLSGLKRCIRLMNLEKRLGFRSCFNFVPEDYPTPPTLMRDLVAAGFEVGVHGLKHDGKLFRHPKDFLEKAPRVNHYLRKWGATGFTSPSMLHKAEWIGELDIEHSCSTFDTDPFEPQPEGANTIFPFLASNHSQSRTYVELPYTLPQDHGLFVILQEKDNRIWKQKLNWVARNGGMAALNTHPDYMNFGGTPLAKEEYPVEHYIDFLEHIRKEYAGQYWHVLPRQMARFWRETSSRVSFEGAAAEETPPMPDKGRLPLDLGPETPGVKIWIDLDNTPHVPFFVPIIRELERRGHEVVLTVRDAFQACDLAEKKGLSFLRVGRHFGKNPIMKITGLVWRSLQLLPFCLRQKPGLSLSHGARSQNLISNLLRIPTVLIADYEHARTAPLTHPRWTIVPESLSPEGLPSKISHVKYYRGIKEDVYVPEFEPTSSLMGELGLREDEMIVTVRPPATEAHYFNPESEVLFVEFMSRICQVTGIRAVLLPRNHAQEQSLRTKFPAWFKGAKTVVPARAVDGLDLLWISDFVVSGGGTMNREAAALGIPVYSIFRGKTGAVDLMLEQQGRLIMIHDKGEVWSKISFVRRDKSRLPNNKPRPALRDIVDHVEDIIHVERVRPRTGKSTHAQH
jgi:hypothetical protein